MGFFGKQKTDEELELELKALKTKSKKTKKRKDLKAMIAKEKAYLRSESTGYKIAKGLGKGLAGAAEGLAAPPKKSKKRKEPDFFSF